VLQHSRRVDVEISGGHFEELLDDLNLTSNVSPAYPPNLPLPDHVHRLITLNCWSRRLEFSEALLGVHSPFDGSMVLFQNVVQVLYGPVSAAAAKNPWMCCIYSTPNKPHVLWFCRSGRLAGLPSF
jgi:hypothetical protein